MRTRTVAVLLFSMLAACAGNAAQDDADTTSADISTDKLKLQASALLPIDEVSGLGQRTTGGKTQYMAIGDSSWTILTFDIGQSGTPENLQQHDTSSLFGSGDSQWEAIAGDASGKVFVESEDQATISVLNSAMSKVEHTISLTIPKDHPLYHSWQADPNSRGEGMVLMNNGHILIAKEKGPSALIEFALKGEAASGWDPSLALAKSASFKVPSGTTSEMQPVAFWELKTDSGQIMGDISELTTLDDGTLYMLTDQGRAIAKPEKTLSPSENKIDLKQAWDLPKEADKPEGLVIVNGSPFVTCDLHKVSDPSWFSISAIQ